jgi:hypothetical protein
MSTGKDRAMPSSRLLFALLLAAGCGHRGLRFPGPLSSMGSDPGDYADRFYEDEESSAGEGDVANPRLRRRIHRDGMAVAEAAGDLVGRNKLSVHGQGYRYDCSGFVEAAHAKAGEPVRGSTKDLYELASRHGVLHKKKRPYIGDVVFFDDSYDRNHNRRRDDELSHIGIVEEVDSDDTIIVVHLSNSGIVRTHMNLRHPDVHRNEAGVTLNDHLRSTSDRDGGPTLTGQLWRGFGSLWAIGDGPLAAAMGCGAGSTG